MSIVSVMFLSFSELSEMIKGFLLLLGVLHTKTTTLNMIMCLEEILSSQFLPGEVLVFSFPASISSPESTSNVSIEFEIINDMLANISNQMTWPIMISTDTQIVEKDIPESHHGYVIFLFPDDDIILSLEDQISALESFTFSFNRRRKFIVVVLDEFIKDSKLTSQNILATLWKIGNIVNAITLLKNKTEQEEHSIYDIYSMFPFQSEECGESDAVNLLDQWLSSGRFRYGNTLFPQKVPSDLHGCNLKILVGVYPPFVIITTNITSGEGDPLTDLEGINLVFLTYLSRAMNFTMTFESSGHSSKKAFGNLLDNRGINIGWYGMIPQLLSYGHFTYPYFATVVQLYVPCARQNPTSGNMFRVFSTPVWLVLMLVLLSETVLLWCYQKNHLSGSSSDLLLKFFLNTLGVLLSVSVDISGTSINFRKYLCVFLYFSFAVSMVFQSFFTSFLIDPGYEKAIENVQDINERRIPFISNEFLTAMQYIVQNDCITGVELDQYCEDLFECSLEMLRHQNSCTYSEKYTLEYEANVRGIRVGTKFCTICEGSNHNFVFVLSRGHPLLINFNHYIQRCLESGLPYQYWSILVSGLNAKNWNSITTNRDTYSALEVFHLKMSFVMLLTGYSLSIFAHLAEHVYCRYYSKNPYLKYKQ
ncbi:Ionotropic receptor 734 [Blattella germanica]|nr:Ionotropic receptor 734 [Blattella germanica]